MCRSYRTDPVDEALVTRLVDAARRAPAAGNSAAPHFLVLEGAQVADYWDTTLPPGRRSAFPWPHLLDAPVLIVLFVDPQAYIDRYSEPDKAKTGLGAGADAWATPYWFVDGGMAAMTLLLGAQDAGLGALFFGVFAHEAAVKEHFGVPAALRAVGAVTLGYPTTEQRKSKSAARGRDSLETVLHRGRW